MIFVPKLLDKIVQTRIIIIYLNNRKHYLAGGVGRAYPRK